MVNRNKQNKSNNKSRQLKINDQIYANEVRVVFEGMEPRVYPLRKAIQIARNKGMDLVEISPNAKPPVCKIIDYKKYVYDQKKKKKEFEAKTQKIVIKEIRFGPNTDKHDFDFKAKNARKFITEGSKVRAYVFFKGRTIFFKEKGIEILEKLIEELEDIAKLESEPKIEGKKLIIMLSPIKQKK